MPHVVTALKVFIRKKVTSCSVITCGDARHADRRDAGQGVHDVGADAAGQQRQQHLLGELAAAALALLARQRADRRPLAPAVRAQRLRARARGRDGELRLGVGGAQRGRQAAQVGLRAARAGGVQEQRVEQHVARGKTRAPMLRCRRRWATSTGTRSRATSATSRGTSTPRPACSTSAAARAGWPTHFPDYTGIDGSPDAVAAASRQGRNVRLGDAGEPLPFPDASFDGVVLKDLLEHVGDPVAVVAEVRRVLRARRARVRLLARRPAVGVGRLHAPPPVHPQGVPAAVPRRRLRRRAGRLRVGDARHLDRLGPHARQAPAGAAARGGVAALRAPQRVGARRAVPSGGGRPARRSSRAG